MKKIVLTLLLILGMAIGITASDVYAKYVLDESINAVSLEASILYDINYNLNGGAISENVSKYTINYSLTLPTPTKKGNDFIGWTGSNGANPVKNVVISKGTTGNLSYIANWSLIKYAISYNLNGGTLSSPISNYNIETNSFILGTPNKPGYDFVGWTGSNGSQPNKTVTVNKGTMGNLSYNANWKVIDYKIDYNLDGGTLNNRDSSYNVETNSFTLGTPNKPGYDFVGWTGSNVSQPNKTITVNKGTVGNLSYTANWNVKTYTVTYQNANGSYHSSSQVNYNDTVPSIEYSVDQVHIFNGWTYGGNIINNLKMPSNNITLVASVREVNCYLITGQATDNDESRAYRFAELVSHKGLGGTVRWGGLGMEFVSNTSNYSHVKDAGNYLMANAPKNSWPYLRWLAISCENGYTEQLR